MAESNAITAEEARAYLNYDAETGLFTRKISISPRWLAGMALGSNDMYGYKTVRINKRSYKLHRLAWLYTYGVWPSGDIDHINGNRSDNRIANLRDVSRQVNLQNQRSSHRNKSTGIMGVYPDRRGNRFTATISVDNKTLYLGAFGTAAEAQAAYLAAKRKHHAGCMV